MALVLKNICLSVMKVWAVVQMKCRRGMKISCNGGSGGGDLVTRHCCEKGVGRQSGEGFFGAQWQGVAFTAKWLAVAPDAGL